MQVIEDEVIGELRYLTVKFDQAELLAGHIGVISQGAVRRYFEGENSDLKVKKCGGLKLDSQRDIVTMRFGIVNNQPEEWLHPLYGGSLKSIAEETAVEEDIKRIEAAADGECIAVSDVFHKTKLLNPGYDELMGSHAELEAKNKGLHSRIDELKDERDRLIKLGERRITRIDELKQSRNHIIDELDETNKQLLAVQERCDALVAAVMQDAQKFSDLLVENEKLRAALQSAQICYENDAYCDMSRIFERALEEDAADLGPEGEPELVDGKPD